jgi:3-phosphoshikimate 1-carboxyvinyltransferase
MFDIEFLDIPPLSSAGGTVRLPGSKSISNRVLLLAALSHGDTTVHDLLASDDTAVMLAALRQLGCSVAQDGNTAVISGLGGRPVQSPAKLFMGNAGTAMRPLTAALALLGGEFELSGVPRMHERPIGDLVDALGNWAAPSTTSATKAFRRCACAPGNGSCRSPYGCAATSPASS